MFRRRVLALVLATAMILGNVQPVVAVEGTTPVSVDGGTVTTNADGSIEISSEEQSPSGTQGISDENGGNQSGTSGGDTGTEVEQNGNTEASSPDASSAGGNESAEDGTEVSEENPSETLEEVDELTSQETEDTALEGETLSGNGLSVSMNEVLVTERNYLGSEQAGAVTVKITNQEADFSPDQTTMSFATLAEAKEQIESWGLDKAYYTITLNEKSEAIVDEGEGDGLHVAGSDDLNYSKATIEGKGVELDLNGNSLYFDGNAAVNLMKISNGIGGEAGIHFAAGVSATFTPQSDGELEISVPIQGTELNLTFGAENSTADSRVNFRGELPDSLNSLTVCGTFTYCGEASVPIKTGNLDLTSGDLYLERPQAVQGTESTYGIVVEKKATLGVGHQLAADPLTKIELADVYVTLSEGGSSEARNEEAFAFELYRKVESKGGSETEALATLSISGSVTWDSQLIVPIQLVKVDEWNGTQGADEETARVPFEENEVLATVSSKMMNTAAFGLEYDFLCIKKEGNELKAVNSAVVVENVTGISRGYTSFEEAAANLAADFGGRADSYTFRFMEDTSLTKAAALPAIVTEASFGTTQAEEGKFVKRQLNLNGFNLTIPGNLELAEGLRTVNDNSAAKVSSLVINGNLTINETATLVEEAASEAGESAEQFTDIEKDKRPAVIGENINVTAKTGEIILYTQNIKEKDDAPGQKVTEDDNIVSTIEASIRGKSLYVKGGNWKLGQLTVENLRISESRHIADQAFWEEQAQLTARQITVNNGVAEIKGILGTEGVQNEASASSTVDATMILNKAKLYVDGEGRAYLTELTVKTNMAYLGESMGDWTVENCGILSIDRVTMQAGTFQNNGGDTVLNTAQLKNVINDAGGRLIVDQLIQSTGSKTYLGAESDLIVKSEAVLYNVNLGDEKGNGGNATLGKCPDAQLTLKGTFTANKEGQKLQFKLVQKDEDLDKVIAPTQEGQLLFLVEANRIFPVEYIQVLPEKVEKDGQQEDNVFCAAYQSGAEIKAAGTYITLLAAANAEAEGQMEELGKFSSWKDMITYLTNTGNVNTTYIVELNTASVDAAGLLTLPKNIGKLIIRGKTSDQATRTTLNYVGDLSFSTNTELENIKLKATKTAAVAAPYEGILKTNGLKLKLTNVEGSFSSITGTTASELTLENGEISVTGRVSGLGTLTLNDSTLTVKGGLNINHLYLIGGIVNAPGAKNSVVVNQELRLKNGTKQATGSGAGVTPDDQNKAAGPSITTEGTIRLNNIFVYTDKASFGYNNSGTTPGLTITGSLTSLKEEQEGESADLEEVYAVYKEEGDNFTIQQEKPDAEDAEYDKIRKNTISLKVDNHFTTAGDTLANAPRISSAWFVVEKDWEQGTAKKLTRKENSLIKVVQTESKNVVLQKDGPEGFYTLDRFDRLQETFTEIDRLADTTAQYRIILKATDTNMVKGKTANYTFPSKAAKVQIAGVEENNVELVYINDITVRSNVDFEHLTLAPTAAGGKINLGNFEVSLKNTLFADGAMDKNQNPTVKAITVIGGGTTKTSRLNLQTDAGSNAAEITLAAVTNVGTLSLEYTKLTVTGNTSAGTLQMDNHTANAVEGFTGLGSISLINVVCGEDRTITTAPTLTRTLDRSTGTTYVSRITPTLTISGTVTVTGVGGRLNITLWDKANSKAISASDEEVDRLISGNGAGIVLAKAPGAETEVITFAAGKRNGTIYKKTGTLIYKETSPTVVLEYQTQIVDNGRTVEVEVESEFEAFADAVTEINNLKTKRPYTIRVLNYRLNDENYNFTPSALTLPNRNYISELTISGYEKGSGADEENNKVYFVGNITFTSNVILDNVDFIQVKKVGTQFEEVDRIPAYADGESFPAVVSVNTAGFTLSFAEGKGENQDALNTVQFNTPILLNGGGKGTLKLGNNVQLEAYGNAGYFVPQDSNSKTYLQGKITGFARLDVSQEMFLAGWPTYNSRTGVVYNASELSVTALNVTQEGRVEVGHEEYQDKVSVGNLTLTGGQLTASGSGSFTNVTLSGDEPKLAITSPIPTVAEGQSAAAIKPATFNITGTLTSTAYGPVLEAGLNTKAESALNITGRVVLENTDNASDNKIKVKVSIPAEILTENAASGEWDDSYQTEDLIKLGTTRITVLEGRAVKEKVVSDLLVRAKNGGEECFVADIFCVGQEQPFDSDISVKTGYILKKTSDAIRVYYADQVGAALYASESAKEEEDQLLLGYYPSFNDAVAAIEAKKNTAQSYTITLFKDVENKGAGIKVNMPRYAKQLTVNGYSTRDDAVKDIYFNQDIILACNTIFEGIGLVPARVNANTYRGIQTKTFELTLRDIVQKNSEAEKTKIPLGSIVGGRNTVILEGQAEGLLLNGNITNVNQLEIRNSKAAASQQSSEGNTGGAESISTKDEFIVTISGNVTVTKLVLTEAKTNEPVGLNAKKGGLLTFVDIVNTGANRIDYGRNERTKAPSLTITGKVRNAEDRLILTTDEAATREVAQPGENQIRVSLANDNKLATINRAPLGSFDFRLEPASESSESGAGSSKVKTVNEKVAWSGNGVYLLSDGYQTNTVTVEWKEETAEAADGGDTADESCRTRCLDLAQASAYINGLSNKEESYTMTLNGDITDPVVTDNVKTSGLTLPAKDRAAQLIIDGKQEATGQNDGDTQAQTKTISAARLAFSGNIVTNGTVKLSYIELNNTKNFTMINRKNSDGMACLELSNLSYGEDSSGKISGITGEKNATRLLLAGRSLEIAGGLANIDVLEVQAELTTNGTAQVNTFILADGGAWKALGVTTIQSVEVNIVNGDAAVGGSEGTTAGSGNTTGYLGTYHSLDRNKKSTGLPQLTITGRVTKKGEEEAAAGLPIKVFDAITKEEITMNTGEGAPDGDSIKKAYENTKLLVAKTEAADKFIAYPYAQWNSSDKKYESSDENIRAYKDGKNYVHNGDISKMQVRLTDETSGGETYVATYAEAIQIINSTGNADAEYVIELRDTTAAGIQGTSADAAANEAVIKTAVNREGNPVEGALTLPQRGKAKAVTIKGEEANRTSAAGTPPADSGRELVLKFTGSITATTDLNFENIRLTEVVKKGADYVDQNSITLNSASYGVSFGDAVVTYNAQEQSEALEENAFYKLPTDSGDNDYDLIFKSIAGKGAVTFNGQDVYSIGDINLSALAVEGEVTLAGKGRIILGEVYGVKGKQTEVQTVTSDEGGNTSAADRLTLLGQKAITLAEIGDMAAAGSVEGRDKISVIINTCYTLTTWKKAVSQLTISGELDEGNTLQVNPYVYEGSVDKVSHYKLLTEEQLENLLITAEEGPAAWKKLLTAPKLKVGENLSKSESVTIGHQKNFSENSLDGQGSQSQIASVDLNNYHLVKYEGGIYLTEEEYALRVEGRSKTGENTYTGAFLSWEQAVKEIDRLNHGPSRNEEGWTYTMVLLEAEDDYGLLKAVTMPSKAAEVIIIGENDSTSPEEESNVQKTNTDNSNIGLLTTSGSIVLKCNTTFRGVHVAAVKKVGNTYYSAPITLNASNFTLKLEEMPKSNRYEGLGSFSTKMLVTGTAKAVLNVVPDKNGGTTDRIRQDSITQISKIGTVKLMAGAAGGSQGDSNQAGTTIPADYTIENGITSVGTLEIAPGAEINCNKKEVAVTNLIIGESIGKNGDDYSSNPNTSTLQAKNITVTGTATMASARLKAGTTIVGDGKVTLNNVVFEDMYNHIEGKQDRNGNSLIQIKGEVGKKKLAEEEEAKDNVVASWPAVTIGLTLNNSGQRYAKLTGGMNLLTAPKAASSWFRPYYNETAKNGRAMGPEITETQVDAKGQEYKQALYGSYKSGNYIKYGKLMEKTGTDETTGKAILQDLIETRLWFGTASENTTYGSTCYSDFMTFEEAAASINTMALKKEKQVNNKITKVAEDYLMELYRDVEIGNTKGDGKYTALTLPTQVTGLNIFGNGHIIQFAGNVTLRSNTILDNVTLQPMKAVKGGAEPTTTNMAAGNFALTLKGVTHCGYYKEGKKADTKEFVSALNSLTGGAKGELIIAPHSGVEAVNVTGFSRISFAGDGNEAVFDGITAIREVLEVTGNLNVKTIVFEETKTPVNAQIIALKGLTTNVISVEGEKIQPVIYTPAGSLIRLNGGKSSLVKAGTNENVSVYYPNGEAKKPQIDLRLIDTENQILDGTRIVIGKYLYKKNWEVSVVEEVWEENGTSRNTYLNGNDLYLGSLTGSTAVN